MLRVCSVPAGTLAVINLCVEETTVPVVEIVVPANFAIALGVGFVLLLVPLAVKMPVISGEVSPNLPKSKTAE